MKYLHAITGSFAILMASCVSTESVVGYDGVTRPGSYYVDYEYVADVRSWGNTGFSSILAGNEESARSAFTTSNEILVDGLNQQRRLEELWASRAQGVNTVVSGGLMVGATLFGINAMNSASDPSQVSSLSNATQQLIGSIGNLSDSIARDIMSSSADFADSRGRSIDRDAWRAVVVSDDPVARSLVRVINETKGSHCTGFFIQPKVIATSAHCFRRGDYIRAFKPAMDNGERLLTGNDYEYRVTRYFWPGDYDPDRACSAHDYAFLLTDRPSGEWLSIETSKPKVGTKVFLMGFSGDLNGGFYMRMDYGCRVDTVGRRDYIRHSCASYGGNSGGPLIRVRQKAGKAEFAAIGVHGCSFGDAGRRASNKRGAEFIGEMDELYQSVLQRDPTAGIAGLF
ncbi:MAG: trypsin-like peptidase domain-containing protein [Pseudomonadota bacterium]